MSSISHLAFAVLFFLQIGDSLERSEDSVRSKIYKNIGGALACFRRMNGTHQIGCSSSMNGDVGVIHVVDETTVDTEKFDVDWITSRGPHAPYIAVLYPSSFRRSVLDKLSSSGRVNGILLLRRNGTKTDQFSTDKSCPNRGYGFYRNPSKELYCSLWNNQTEMNELLFRDWGFPMFYVPDVAEKDDNYGIDSILDCFNKYSRPDGNVPREWPLCAAQLSSFMSAAVDTPTCIRRSQHSELSITQRKDCDPLDDRNLITSLIPSNQTHPYPDKSVIVIAARLDSASLFDAMNPAADTVATALTTLLATLKQLYEIKDKLLKSSIKNVYFVLFNGEAFDYIGSSRVVYDMSLDKFPLEITDNKTFLPALLRIKDIKYYIELNQVALRPTESYYVHQNWESKSAVSDLEPLIQRLVSNGQSQTLNIVAPSGRPSNWMGVPPSSLQSFLSNSSDFPGIVISNHQGEYRNKYYNSIFDDEDSVGEDYEGVVESLARLATTVACTVEGLVDGNEGPCSITKDITLVGSIFECYVVSGKCDLFKNVSSAEVIPHLREKPNFYVGVASTKYDLLKLTSLTKNVLSYFQGDIVNRTEEKCHPDEMTKNLNYMYLNGSGDCYETTTVATEALSPAFVIKNYDWKSGQYSTWTESVWAKMYVRIFLKPSFAHELTTFLCGLAVFGISFVLVGWISRKTDVIFPSRPEQIC